MKGSYGSCKARCLIRVLTLACGILPYYIPVVPHKAVAEVSKIGNLYFLQPDALSAARETQQGNESTINQRKQEMI